MAVKAGSLEHEVGVAFGPRVGDDRLQAPSPRGGLAGGVVVDESALAVPQGPRRVPTGQSEDDGDLGCGDPLAAQLMPARVAGVRLVWWQQLDGTHRGPLSLSASTVSRQARTASRSSLIPVRQRRVMGRSSEGGWQWGQRWAW